jgi:hypothetical protein
MSFFAIGGVRSGVAEDSVPMYYDVASMDSQIPTFRGSVVSSFRNGRLLENCCQDLSDVPVQIDTVSCAMRKRSSVPP